MMMPLTLSDVAIVVAIAMIIRAQRARLRKVEKLRRESNGAAGEGFKPAL